MAGGRKRVVKKDVVAEAQEEDEPVAKKRRGGGRQKTAKVVAEKEKEEQIEEMEEKETTPTVITKGKRGAGRATKNKGVEKEEPGNEDHEIEEEETTPTVITKGKRGAGRTTRNKKMEEEEPGNKDHEIEEEEATPTASEPEKKAAKRGRKPLVKTEDEGAVAPIVAKLRGRPSKKQAVQEGEPVIKKEKRGRKPAIKAEEEENTGTAPSQKGNKGKGAMAKDKQEVKEEEEEEVAPSTSKKGKKGRGKATKTKEEDDELPASNGMTQNQGKTTNSATTSGVERKVVVKGRAAVDALCPIAQTSHVYEHDDDIWDCMLNQTNIQFNNNKYYLIQLLEDDSCKSYSVWMRWGRVGANGQNSLQPCGSDLDKAMKIFKKKFSDKTRNEWELRDIFEKVPGKYDLLKMDYSKGEDTPDTAAAIKKSKEKAAVESLLHPIVRAVIELICDVRRMEEAVVEMKYDAKKAPLGKLTTEQIKAGYLALKHIDDLIQSAKYTTKDLVQACNDFYTRIPHYFGMKVPPLISTSAEVREKVALLEALGDIQAALSVLDQPIDVDTHPADQHYHNLKCDLTPVKKDSQEYKIIENYMKTTHAKTHNQYKLQLLEVLECHKDSEHKRFKDVGNRMLLWHGSRMSNWAGILSQGLRIAPPEAPVTGYMFGKGIYFADMASKSANYCWANARSNVGFLLLSEVALGKSNDLLHANYSADKLPQGCHSVKGCGRTAPQPENFTKLPDGTVVPLGPGVQVAAKTATSYSLLYNEYIVYDPAQVLTRFLLKVQFDFK